LVECLVDSDIKNSWIILRRRPLASSSEVSNIESMMVAEWSRVISVGCARNKKPVSRVREIVTARLNIHLDIARYALSNLGHGISHKV
jgi:hypothetical protein